MQQLLNDDDIVSRPVEKGSCMVDKKVYQQIKLRNGQTYYL